MQTGFLGRTIRRVSAFAACVGALSVSAAALAQPESKQQRRPAIVAAGAVQMGIYSDVRPGTDGHMGGHELRVNRDTVEIVICEGECASVLQTGLVRQGNTVRFTFQGNGLDGVVMTVAPAPGGVTLRYAHHGRQVVRRLVRRPRELGLSIARSAGGVTQDRGY